MTRILHGKVPEARGNRRAGGEHRDVSLEGHKSDRSLGNSVGMLVSWRSALELVSVLGRTMKELRRLIIRLSIASDESRVRWVRCVVSAHCNSAIMIAVTPFGV